MIRPPRRSVTRFFIPLIDVLILLFCIFLLMPYVKPSDGDAEGAGKTMVEPPPPSPEDVSELNREIEALKHERERLIRERSKVLERLAIRVLQIDRDTGKLYDYDPERVEIATQAEAQALIDRQKRTVAGRDVYFLLLFPRELSGYPLQKQMAAYETWFKDVPHGFDNPRGELKTVPEITHIVGRIAAAIFGALVGAILTAIVVWLVCRTTVKKQPPKPVRRLLRILGAIAGALGAVLFLPIGYGGFGLGLGPGGAGFSPSASSMVTPSKPEPKPTREPDGRPTVRARVVMLGGPLVVGEASYRIEDERTARTLADVQAHLREGMKRSPPVNVLEIQIYDDSLARRSAQVMRLNDWATQAGLRVDIVLMTGSIPP